MSHGNVHAHVDIYITRPIVSNEEVKIEAVEKEPFYLLTEQFAAPWLSSTKPAVNCMVKIVPKSVFANKQKNTRENKFSNVTFAFDE